MREESGYTQAVRRFGVPKKDGEGEIDNTIVATKLSDSNPRDVRLQTCVSSSSDNYA